MTPEEFDQWCPKPTPENGRRTGHTTQLVDWYIQRLFMAGQTGDICDQYIGQPEAHSTWHKHIEGIITGRINFEHGGIKMYRVRPSRLSDRHPQYMQIALK